MYFAKFGTILVLLSLIYSGNSANILGLMGVPSRSHHIWNKVIFNSLAEKGHTLTIVGVDAEDSPNDNISYIHLEETYKVMNEYYKNYNKSSFWEPLSNVLLLYDFQMVTCKGILQSRGFQEALNLGEKFDLILYDVSAGPCLLRLIQNYPDVPVVGVSAFKITPEILDIVGGHNYPAYIPFYINQLDIPLSFWERLYNTGTYAIAHMKFVTDSVLDTMVGRHFPNPKPSLDDLNQRLQVILVNTHPALDYAQSLPPSVIEVGGLHIKEPQPLSQDIKEFIENAERGAVYIAFGTNIKTESLGEARLEAFVKVIERFPKYNFLWKIETEGLLKTVPKNLLIRKWFPQNDILGHPNVKAFFTHAGGLSIQEASWHGVPVVAMPFFLDQISNAHRVEVKGCGRIVDFNKLTEKSLFQGLSGVLTDDVYRSNMLEIQKQFRSRQNKPLDVALWWIDHVLSNPRVDYLIPSSRNLCYLVSNSLDIVLIVVAIGILFLINFWIVLKNIKLSLSKSKGKSVKVKSSSKDRSLSKKKVKKN